MKSDLRPPGSRYTAIREVRLPLPRRGNDPGTGGRSSPGIAERHRVGGGPRIQTTNYHPDPNGVPARIASKKPGGTNGRESITSGYESRR